MAAFFGGWVASVKSVSSVPIRDSDGGVSSAASVFFGDSDGGAPTREVKRTGSAMCGKPGRGLAPADSEQHPHPEPAEERRGGTPQYTQRQRVLDMVDDARAFPNGFKRMGVGSGCHWAARDLSIDKLAAGRNLHYGQFPRLPEWPE